MSNPLLSQYRVPPFADIKPEHFAPAFDAALESARAKFNDIIECTDAPNFDNAVAVFDDLFKDLKRINNILDVFVLNASNDEIDNIAEATELKFSDFVNEVLQNPVAAARFKTVYDDRDNQNLDDQDLWFLQNTYWEFEDAGTLLNDSDKAQLQAIDKRLIALAADFRKNLDKAKIQNSFLVEDESELDGLPNDVVSGMRKNAMDAGHDKGWLFIPERLLVGDLLCVAHNRDFRRKIHDAMYNIGRTEPFDNRGVIKDIQKGRHERAQLLGYENYAECHLPQTMAGSTKRIQDLTKQTLDVLNPAFERDVAILQAWIDDQGGPKMEPWDIAYYSALYKQEKFDFDGGTLTEYLELENVLQGWVLHAEKGMNVKLTPIDDQPKMHADVRTYRVMDLDTGIETILYFDVFARSNKSGGAWMHDVQTPDSGLDRPNIVVLNLNLVQPSDDSPVLMNVSQVKTLYHEGGHGLNGIKGANTKYKTRMGVNGPTDFSEIPSMIDENWCMQPEVLATYAFHHETGDVVPTQLIDAMKNASQFMVSAGLLLMVQNSLRDVEFHSMNPDEYVDDVTVERRAAIDTPHIELVRPYPLARFHHLFMDGLSQYAAGYYGYFWSDVAQAQAFEPFMERGLYDADLSALKREFYAAGASLSSDNSYHKFTGRNAGDPSAFLKSKGLTPG